MSMPVSFGAQWIGPLPAKLRAMIEFLAARFGPEPPPWDQGL